MATSIAIVSDTHMPKGTRVLPDRCVKVCRDADLIIHAGDFSEGSVLSTFEGFGPPVVAVHGNVDSPDLRELLPRERVIEVEEVRLGLIHDAGARKGRIARMAARFPGCDAVIFGHSHLPLHETENGFQIFNPGSPTERRRSPFKSMGTALVDGATVKFDLIDLET